MNLPQILDFFKSNPDIANSIAHWEVIPPRKSAYADFPEELHPQLKPALEKKGIHKLYTHQRTAFNYISEGRNIVVVTPTASGKTLCYDLAVLNSILYNPQKRALYLFPTKALSRDQVAELYELIQLMGANVKVYTFDGDTQASARRVVRTAGQIVVTNPDMLHAGILPHHTKWINLFESLQYVVIDEVHYYRGVLGSHLANIIRRLKRICQFHGSSPQFICCSATIANPKELTQKLLEEEVALVDNNGAPSGSKHFLFYNPPVINQQLGIRKSSVTTVSKLAIHLITNGVQTIVFAPSRLKVEVLLSYLKESAMLKKLDADSICGYRSGYLPNERRKVEAGLRSGEIKGVVSTNALELGIDIGQLEACVITGYPGNIASTWQQAGRAGRRHDLSVAILVANSSPLDQYLMTHPDYFFSKTPEHGLIDPNNLLILTSHLKCAAFELPFREGEKFGVDSIKEILNYLEQNEILHYADGQWYWNSEIYPAEEVNIRSVFSENFVVLNTSQGNKVIGEVDYYSAQIFLFQEAIYLHQGRQYQIQELDWEGKKAYAKEVEVDYYTDCEIKTEIKVLHKDQEKQMQRGVICLGEVAATTAAVLFKKIKFETHENIGSGRIYLPETEHHTTAFWYQFPENITLHLNISQQELGGALRGVSRVFGIVAPLWVMCDPWDVRTTFYLKAPFSGLPSIYLADNYPGGIGIAEKIFTLQKILWRECADLIMSCPCLDGCPSCVGPVLEVGEKGKSNALKLLNWMTG